MKYIIGAFIIFAILMFVGVPYVIFKMRRVHKDTLPSFTSTESGSGSQTVPLLASYRGVKGIPLFAFAYNNRTPQLILNADGITCTVMSTFSKTYDDIENVSVRETMGTENIRIAFKDSILTFDANLKDRESLKNLVSEFSRKGVALSSDAQALLQ